MYIYIYIYIYLLTILSQSWSLPVRIGIVRLDGLGLKEFGATSLPIFVISTVEAIVKIEWGLIMHTPPSFAQPSVQSLQ